MPVDKNEIIKGFYSLFNRNVEGGITVQKKKGSEVKMGLGKIITSLNEKKSNCIDKINSGIESIKFNPDQKVNTDYAYLMDFVPMKFSYDMIYYGKKEIDTSKGIKEEVVVKPTPEEQAEMREYNDNVYNYIKLCEDKIKAQSLYNSIQDSKSYNLTVEQLSLLGM